MTRSLQVALASSVFLVGLAGPAFAQQYAPPPPGYGPPPSGYGAPQGYAPYGQSPGYAPYGNYAPMPGPPPPPQPSRPTCCSWSARVNPFDLIFRRLSFEGELAIAGPLTIGVSPTWIWGSPTENVDSAGYGLAADIGVYVEGRAMRGFWIKGHVGYEHFTATLTDPDSGAHASATVASPILGGMLGSSTVFGRNGGFVLSGGIGIGVATADKVHLEVVAKTADGQEYVPASIDYYDKAGKIQLLGSFALGVAF